MNPVQTNQHEIAVIGMSGRFPEADGLTEFWENLRVGRGSIRPFPTTRIAELEPFFPGIGSEEFAEEGYLAKISYFDPAYFHLSAEEACYMDPQQRLLLELVEEALQNAGYTSDTLAKEPVGVFFAGARNEYGSLIDRRIPLAFVNSVEAALAGRVAYTFNFTGPALTIDTACSSSLAALHYACQSLRNQECRYAIAGGVRLEMLPRLRASLQYSPVASQSQRVRAFDKAADGTVGGEGGALLLLKPLAKALVDGDLVHAVIKGSWLNNDGRRSNGLSAPSPTAQAEVIRQALTNAQIDPETISYIETHGTGTRLGDPIEVEGIAKAFTGFSQRKQWLGVGSVKTNIGHLDGASGIANVVKVILALQHQELPPTLGFTEPNPLIDLVNSPVYVNTTLQEWQSAGVRRAGVTSLGLIGTNVHMIVEEAPPRTIEPVQENLNLITLSAQQTSTLQVMLQNLANFLRQNDRVSVDDIAYTLNVGRKHLLKRIALLVNSREELMHELWRWSVSMQSESAEEWTQTAPFAQSSGELRQTTPFAQSAEEREEVASFKQSVDERVASFDQFTVRPKLPAVPEHLKPVLIYGDLAEVSTEALADLLAEEPEVAKAYAQCLQSVAETPETRFFALQYAYSHWLALQGIKPKSVLGIGCGKCVSDVIKHSLSLEEGVQHALAYHKADSAIPLERLRTLIQKMADDGQNLFVLIGAQEGILAQLGQIAEEQGLFTLPLGLHRASLYAALQKLYLAGYPVDWENFYLGKIRKRVAVSAYVFNRQSYLFDPAVLAKPLQTQEFLRQCAPKETLDIATFEEIKSIIASVLPETLHLEQDFSTAGGDSLMVLQIVQRIKQRYQRSLPMQVFYSAQSLQQIIENIVHQINQRSTESSAHAEGINSSLSEILEFSLDVEQMTIEQQEPPKKVFLTGATGFLGAHLLAEMLTRTDAEVYCLVRGETVDNAKLYLQQKLAFYFDNRLWPRLSRVISVCGDLCSPKMGMSAEEYAHLAETIDTIIHSAADVRHYGAVEQFHKTNVEGTAKILEFCQQGRAKRLHHMSTLAVGECSGRDQPFRENNLFKGLDGTGNVYARSKLEAEMLVYAAGRAGLEATVYRVGNLAGRYSDGVFQDNIETNALYNNLKAILTLGQIPASSLTLEVEFTPVDLCATAIVQILLQRDALRRTFHLRNPHMVSLRQFQQYVQRLGFLLKTVPEEQFVAEVQEQVRRNGFSRELSLIYQMLRGARDGTVQGEHRPIVVTSAFTEGVLQKDGFAWPTLDFTYFANLLQYCSRVGYILPPREQGNVGAAQQSIQE